MIKAQHQSFENASYYRTRYRYNSLSKFDIGKMHGVRRVIIFCLLTIVIPTILIIIPLYLRNILFADVLYQVAESDVIEIREGISTIFCQEHVLQMNTTFSAYQLHGSPEVSKNRKHIRLKKSMRLPDDTLEYWGFYLLEGATVHLKACSRFDGGRILIVRGERNLRTCGLLEHNLHKYGMDKEHKQVQVTFETAAQEVIVDKINLNNKETHTDMNTAEEDMTEDEDVLNMKILKKQLMTKNKTTVDQLLDSNEKLNESSQHTKRHERKRLQEIKRLTDELNEIRIREKRETGHKLDGAIGHGGNALNHTELPISESSISSFENNLLTCYDGQILLAQAFPLSPLCTDVNFLENGIRIRMTHEVNSDGYYYYIFYSDNDLVSNDIHAIFDIYKPTFQYNSTSDSKQCINKTECSFNVSFFSGETVIVEVPTRDGIEHEPDDISQLLSVCKPRVLIYMIFPILILFLILGCAFL